MNTILLTLLKKHVASSFLLAFFISLYLYGGHGWVEAILPINGKPLAVFMFVGLALVYEITNYGQKRVITRLEDISLAVEIGQLTTAVNAMYFRFIASGDEYIDNEYTIKEIGQLMDTRERLKVNSYVEGRLSFLQRKIKGKKWHTK